MPVVQPVAPWALSERHAKAVSHKKRAVRDRHIGDRLFRGGKQLNDVAGDKDEREEP